MMGRLKSDQGQLFYEFRLGDAIPEDHLVRKIDAALDLSWLRGELASYDSSMGRPSIDPELMGQRVTPMRSSACTSRRVSFRPINSSYVAKDTICSGFAGGHATTQVHEACWSRGSRVTIGGSRSKGLRSVSDCCQRFATSRYTLNLVKAIKQGLFDFGLVEGRDYSLQSCYAEGDYERFPALAQELAQTGTTIILAHTIASVRAAQKLNPPIAVVMLSINDPVGAGLVVSLSKPAGNTTGLANLEEDLTTKLLEFQRSIVPTARTMAALFNPRNPTHSSFLEKLRAQAEASA